MDTDDTQFILTDVNDLRSNAIATTSLATTTFFMIEPENTESAEIVMCRRNGYDQVNKKFANCERGLAFYGDSEVSVSANIKSHPAGSTVVISDVGQFFNQYANIWDAEKIYGEYTFATTTANAKIKLYFNTQFGNNYIWYDTVSDTMGFSTSSSEFAFNANGTSFTPVTPLSLTSGELKIATTSNDFVLDGSNNFSIRKNNSIISDATGLAVNTSTSFIFDGARSTTTNAKLINATSSQSLHLEGEIFQGWNNRIYPLSVPTTSAATSTVTGQIQTQTLFSKTITGGSLGSNGAILLKTRGKWSATSGALNQINIQLGGENLCQWALNATFAPEFQIECLIFNQNSQSAQRGSGTMFYGNGDVSANTSGASAINILYSTTTAKTLNTANDQNLTVQGVTGNGAGDFISIIYAIPFITKQ